jgi:hypothetical protein
MFETLIAQYFQGGRCLSKMGIRTLVKGTGKDARQVFSGASMNGVGLEFGEGFHQ